ncbi:MAG: S8 family serine peptidase [Gemmatimonadaceae bacterium]
MPALRIGVSERRQSIEELRNEVHVSGGRVFIALKRASAARVEDSGVLSALTLAEAQEAIRVLEARGVVVERSYSFRPLLAAKILVEDLDTLVRLPVVDYIEAIGQSRAQSSQVAQDTSWAVSSIGAPSVWASQYGPGNRGEWSSVTILDHGIDQTHLISGDGPANVILNCFYVEEVSPEPGYEDNPSCYLGGSSHGVHVAGLIASRDDGSGYIGTAPEIGQFTSIRVCHRLGSCPTDWVIEGIDWAISLGLPRQILNISLGSCHHKKSYLSAITRAQNAGILVVAVAGNAYADDGDCPDAQSDIGIHDVMYPARYPGVLAVGGVNPGDSPVPMGPRPPPPGGDGDPDPIPCTASSCNEESQSAACGAKGARSGPQLGLVAPFWSVSMTKHGEYGILCGTSMSAALVSGVAAMVWTQNPSWTASQVRERIISSAAPLGASFTTGRLYAIGAVVGPPLTVSITGPSHITTEGSYTWSASTSGSGPLSYSWKYAEAADGPFEEIGTSATVDRLVLEGPPPEFWLRVTISANGVSATATTGVTNSAVNPCAPLVCLNQIHRPQ